MAKVPRKKNEKRQVDKIPTMLSQIITEEVIKDALSQISNWRATGSDYIHRYWYKKFCIIFKKTVVLFEELFRDPKHVLTFITTENTYLLSKTNPAQEDPSVYWHITLQTIN